jgi:uncharacterized protein
MEESTSTFPITLLVILAIALNYILLCYFVAGTTIHLNRQPVPKNPKEYGMSFENADFRTSDSVNIKGWLIPGTLNKLIIMTHVGGLTKCGSTVAYRNLTKLYNEEIEFLKTAKHLHNEGYWVLMFDFRNHGESGPDPNKGIASVGSEEYKDVLAALDYVKRREDLGNVSVGFVSFCMGANSTIIAMSKNPEAFKNVKCLFAVPPISMEVFVHTYAGKLFSQTGADLLLPLVKKFILWRGAHPLEKMSPREYAKDIKVPTLYVQARNDPWTDSSSLTSDHGFFSLKKSSYFFDILFHLTNGQIRKIYHSPFSA